MISLCAGIFHSNCIYLHWVMVQYAKLYFIPSFLVFRNATKVHKGRGPRIQEKPAQMLLRCIIQDPLQGWKWRKHWLDFLLVGFVLNEQIRGVSAVTCSCSISVGCHFVVSWATCLVLAISWQIITIFSLLCTFDKCFSIQFLSVML